MASFIIIWPAICAPILGRRTKGFALFTSLIPAILQLTAIRKTDTAAWFVVAFTPVFTVFWLTWYAILYKSYQKYLVQHQGDSICYYCGYIPNTKVSPRCPECGKEYFVCVVDRGNGNLGMTTSRDKDPRSLKRLAVCGSLTAFLVGSSAALNIFVISRIQSDSVLLLSSIAIWPLTIGLGMWLCSMVMANA